MLWKDTSTDWIRFYNKCINDVYVQCLHGDTENMSACLRCYIWYNKYYL